MKKKYFVFSDVHGKYSALQESLHKLNYDPTNENHILVSLGDNFDRGENSAEIYDLLRHNRSICIKGNHETFLEEALEKGMDGEYVLFNCLHNGLTKTLQSFAFCPEDGNYISVENIERYIKYIQKYNPELLSWLKELPLYYETENYIFVHAGINPNIVNWKETDEHFMLWDIEESHKMCPNTNRIVIIGHHHAFRVRQNILDAYGGEEALRLSYAGCEDEHRPVRIFNKIAIDSCSNYTNKVNVIVIEDNELGSKNDNIDEYEQTIVVTNNNTNLFTNDDIITTINWR